MGFKVGSLAAGLRELRKRGIDGVIIGSTIYLLRLGLKELEDDVDLFTTTVSPTIDEDLIRDVAEELNCFLGQTGWGTPQLRCVFNEDEITFDLYENLYDFYIPEEFLVNSEDFKVGRESVRLLRVEDYLILKAKTGRVEDEEDLRLLADYIKSRKLRINLNVLREHMGLFEEYEQRIILRKLREAGILR